MSAADRPRVPVLTRMKKFIAKLTLFTLVAGVIAAAMLIGLGIREVSKTIHNLLEENEQLRGAIGRLTAESRVAYARVIEQSERDGRLCTTLRFVEVARDDPSKRIFEKTFEIDGAVVHFDALIVKFDDRYVADGKERALYLWRRLYGEHTPPEKGHSIEPTGAQPARYNEIFAELPIQDRDLFWSGIWKLADDKDYLEGHGIRAIYGNVVYRHLKPGLIYVIKITNTGQVYIEPDPVPAL